jgi:uncharacterized membrane protein
LPDSNPKRRLIYRLRPRTEIEPPADIAPAIEDAPLSPQELSLLAEFRSAEPARTATVAPPETRADHIADRVAAIVGSWRFLIAQSVFFAVWVVLNAVGWWAAWDPYPFILLNLVLSVQAAYTAPIIMMSQNRQAAVDRHQARTEYQINAQAALEIKLLHQKIDELREFELEQLRASLDDLHRVLNGPGRDRRSGEKDSAGAGRPAAPTLP